MTASPVKGNPAAGGPRPGRLVAGSQPTGGPALTAGLVVDGLSVAYPAGPVLHDIRLAVRPGETFGLVGESGCGKTTLGYLLGGHLEAGGRVLGGRILVDGVDVLSLRPAALRHWRASHIAFVHQEAAGSLDPTMRVGRQVADVLRAQGLPRRAAVARARELLSRVRLPDVDALARRYPHQLSGGQQQRVVIACALATRPRLLVLDEPTTGLDASVQHEVLGLLTGLAAELATAVVLVSHDLPLVGQACDRVGVLYAGRLVEVGPVGEVLAAPAHPYTVALLDSAPTLGVPRAVRPLAAIPGRPPRPGETGYGCRFAPRCPAAVDTCRSAEPALEDLAATGHAVRCLRPGAVGRAVPDALPAAAERPGPVLLQVRGLTRRYGHTLALDNVDLTIHRGEVVGLVGESGSGKTTLARAVVGLGPPGGGSISLDGQELPARVTQRSPQLRRRVQMVFQNPDTTLNPEHRVRRILRRAIHTLRGHDDVPALARRAQLDDDLLDCLPARLSGGQKQRVAIARSFAGSPALVVCDEPVSALDVSVQAGVLEVLAQQRDHTGTSYLFISHDLAVVGYLADRIAVLYHGVLVEQGPTQQVLAGPHHPYTARLVAASAPAAAESTVAEPAAVVAPEPSPVDPAGNGHGCRYVSRCPYRIAGRCDRVAPPAVALGDGHLVRCHLDPASLPSATWLAPWVLVQGPDNQ